MLHNDHDYSGYHHHFHNIDHHVKNDKFIDHYLNDDD
jgi:hypothetical protein